MCRTLGVILSLLSFGPSYVRFAFSGEWHFAGVHASPLAPVQKKSSWIISLHVMFTLVWMSVAFHQFYNLRSSFAFPLNIKRHRIWGRVGLVAHFVGLCFIVEPQQMTSCRPTTWPLFGEKSRDASNTATVIACFILHAVQGVLSAMWVAEAQTSEGKTRLRREHAQFMAQAFLASSNAALMRLLIMPAVFVMSKFWFRGIPSDGEWVSIGEWLAIKQVAYSVLGFCLVLPCFVPSWSPYASEALALFNGQRMGSLAIRAKIYCCMLFGMAWKVLDCLHGAYKYLATIGVDGGPYHPACRGLHQATLVTVPMMICALALLTLSIAAIFSTLKALSQDGKHHPE